MFNDWNSETQIHPLPELAHCAIFDLLSELRQSRWSSKGRKFTSLSRFRITAMHSSVKILWGVHFSCMKVRQLLYLQTETHSWWPTGKTSLNYFDLIKSLNKKQRFHSVINKQFLRIRVILISWLFQHLFSFRLAWEGARRTGRTKNRPRTSLRIRLNSDMMPTLSHYQYKWQSCFFKCAHNYVDRFLIKIRTNRSYVTYFKFIETNTPMNDIFPISVTL